MSYNYTDPSISNLIANTHVPVELTVTLSPPIPAPQVLELRCAKCYNTWPCPTIVEYRASIPVSPPPPPRTDPGGGSGR